MTAFASFARLHRWLKPLVLALCVLAIGIAGQVTAADLGADTAASIAGAAAPAASSGADAATVADDCAPVPGKKGEPGHCAACCMHMSGQLLADETALAGPVRYGAATMFAAVRPLPPSTLVPAPDQPPQA